MANEIPVLTICKGVDVPQGCPAPWDAICGIAGEFYAQAGVRVRVTSWRRNTSPKPSYHLVDQAIDLGAGHLTLEQRQTLVEVAQDICEWDPMLQAVDETIGSQPHVHIELDTGDIGERVKRMPGGDWAKRDT